MILALILFVITYVLMLVFQKYRPYIALTSALVFMILGSCNLFDKSFNFLTAIQAVDYNVLLMIAGMMGIVSLFIASKMPNLLADKIISKVPNVKWAVVVLCLFSGIISAFLDNVATVLMVAPIGLSICKKLKISPIGMIIAIAVSSNLQGAATLVGDTTSILLSSALKMNFFDFFIYKGKLSLFWGVQLGALASILIILFLFRKNKEKIDLKGDTTVEDYFPSIMLLGTIVLLIAASFIPEPKNNQALETLFNLRNGIIVFICFLIALIRQLIKDKNFTSLKLVAKEFDYQTVLLLFGLFIVIAGIEAAGVIDAIAELFTYVGNNIFLIYTIIVFGSVVISAFVDNIPYVATMLPVVASLAIKLNIQDPTVLYFGLLIGATLGGNLTPIGASANITGIGILRKNGEDVKTIDFLKIGVPFTLAAVLTGYLYIWLIWGL